MTSTEVGWWKRYDIVRLNSTVKMLTPPLTETRMLDAVDIFTTYARMLKTCKLSR